MTVRQHVANGESVISCPQAVSLGLLNVYPFRAFISLSFPRQDNSVQSARHWQHKCHPRSRGGFIYCEHWGNITFRKVSIYKATRRHIPETVMLINFDKFLVSIGMWLSILFPQKQLHVTCRWRKKTGRVTYLDSRPPRKFYRHRSIPNGQEADCELGSCWPRNRTPGDERSCLLNG